MNPKTNPIQLRAVQYFYIDGLLELALGGLFLLLAAYFWVDAILPGSFLAGLLDAAFILILAGGYYLAGRAVRRLKERITYPRTGYVAYHRKPQSGKRALLAGGLGALVSGGLVYLVAARPFELDLMPAATGLIAALVFGLLAYRTAIRRFYGFCLAALALGTGLMVSGAGNLRGLALFYTAFSALLLAAGGLVLRRYLQQHPPVAEEPHES